jgi:hypothetical protein
MRPVWKRGPVPHHRSRPLARPHRCAVMSRSAIRPEGEVTFSMQG